MKLKTSITVSNVSTWEELRRFVSQMTSDLVDIINGHISFTDNCDISLITVSFPGSGTTVKTAHGLKRMPTGYIVAGLSASLVVFDGNKANTTDDIYLQSSAAGTAQIMVF